MPLMAIATSYRPFMIISCVNGSLKIQMNFSSDVIAFPIFGCGCRAMCLFIFVHKHRFEHVVEHILEHCCIQILYEFGAFGQFQSIAITSIVSLCELKHSTTDNHQNELELMINLHHLQLVGPVSAELSKLTESSSVMPTTAFHRCQCGCVTGCTRLRTTKSATISIVPSTGRKWWSIEIVWPPLERN